jgi:protein-L-isoaspartate(D-aspartate) O-methyltransferase
MPLTERLEQARFNMIEQQIRPWEVLDPSVLALLSVVRREQFVPLAHKALAFVDMALPLLHPPEEALGLGQSMLTPKVEARLLQELKVQPHETVLEIGSGSGYMAALLAHRAQHVVSLEIHPELVSMARTNLENAGLSNVQVRRADGSQGYAANAPFDVILLSGSVAQVPQSLLAQLQIGGRLAAIVGYEPVMRLHVVTRTGAATFHTRQPWDTLAPRLQHFPEPSRFHF